jgi:hypothetical protein
LSVFSARLGAGGVWGRPSLAESKIFNLQSSIKNRLRRIYVPAGAGSNRDFAASVEVFGSGKIRVREWKK